MPFHTFQSFTRMAVDKIIFFFFFFKCERSSIIGRECKLSESAKLHAARNHQGDGVQRLGTCESVSGFNA